MAVMPFSNQYQDAIEAMRADGLMVDSLIADGGWHRCAVDKGRRNQDGSYKVINSDVVIWSNWVWGLQGQWFAKSRDTMTRKERRDLEAEIARAREEDRKRREAAQAEAAMRAAHIWEHALPATDEHGYLKRKQVEPGPCRLGQDGRLVMPLYDGEGELASVQFISPQKRQGYTDKWLLRGGRKKGCYCPIEADAGKDGEALLIAEGFATAMSLHEATGFETWVALDCHNLLEVAKLARERFKNRKIGICADNDKPMLPNFPDKGGIGAALGRKAAESIGGYFILCPLFEGRDKADFNDLACELGLPRVQAEIEAALKGEPVADCVIPEVFNLRTKGPKPGLYWKQPVSGGLTKEVRIGEPLRILAYTRTGEGDSWGVLLAWRDMDGRAHQMALPHAQISNQHGDWLASIVNEGWRCDSSYKKQIASYLENSKPVKRIRCATNTGWIDDRYLLPDRVYGNGEDQIVLQATGYKDLYQERGSLEEWQELPKLCAGNPKHSFALCCAFTGPLLKLAEMEGCLFSFEGGSSCGKTTALNAAASVWGNPKYHRRSWRATDNGLEMIAELHNDNLLILDELGEAKAKTLSETVYMLSGGQGKDRAKRDTSGLRKTYRWNMIGLSSGELGLADKLMEADRQTRAGLDTRFIAIPVGRKDIAELHGMTDSSQLVERIARLAGQSYGTAGRAFLEALTQEEALRNAKASLRDEIEKEADKFCPAGSDGQVRRVALRFALVSIAGTLAQGLGILPAGFEAREYARACFTDWLEQRGGIGPAEDMAILNQVELFFERHGQSRFQVIGQGQDYNDSPCPNQAGFRESKGGEDGITYYCWPQTFRAEIVKGYSPKRALEALAAAGWLRKGNKGFQIFKRLPNHGPKWVYKIRLPLAKDKEAREDA